MNLTIMEDSLLKKYLKRENNTLQEQLHKII